MGDETTTEKPVSIIEDSCNIPEIIALASSAPPLTTQAERTDITSGQLIIAVTRDPAFFIVI